MNTIFDKFTTLAYFISAVLLVLISLAIMSWSAYEIFITIVEFPKNKEFITIMLQAVGAIIIATAVIDVAKYMIEEEVSRSKELRDPKEARETLTKIMTIIAITVSIEGIVFIFKAGTKDLTLLVYPALLIITAVIVIAGMAFYQKISLGVEDKVE